MSRIAISLALAWFTIAVFPDAAAACSVCYAGAEESRKAFLFTAVLLSLLPLSMIGALVWLVWRSARDGDGADSP